MTALGYTLKRGVILLMSPQIEKMLSVICPVFNVVRLPVVITSGFDGPHREDSLHSLFLAIDIRKVFDNVELSETWNIHRQYLLDSLGDFFRGKKYPVIVFEETDHIHFEWAKE